MPKPQVLVLGTCDSKYEETFYIRQQLNHLFPALGAEVMDVGRYNVPNSQAKFNPSELVSQYLSDTQDALQDLDSLSRADYIGFISKAATRYVKQLYEEGRIHGLVAAGGSSGSSLCAAIMRNAVPIGFPKVLVSTMASGDISPYIDNVDITMMYSVTDIAGLNYLSRQILSNAAGAIGGMVLARSGNLVDKQDRKTSEPNSQNTHRPPRVGITMFGVTTPGVDAIRSILTTKHGYEVLVFHATGSGGRAMERLCREGGLDGVIDLTTTEIADEIVGGVLAAGPHRMEAPVNCGIPYVVSVGACDMVNFGPKNTVPEKWIEKGRKIYVHNPTVTLMRTTKEECGQIADFIVGKLKLAKGEGNGNFKVVIPLGGISLIAGKDGPFEDRDADEELFKRIEEGLKDTGVEVVKDENSINDERFAQKIVDTFVPLMERHGSRERSVKD